MARIQDLAPEILDIIAQNVHGAELVAMRLCDKGSKTAADPYFCKEYMTTRNLKSTKKSFEHLINTTAHKQFKHWLKSVKLPSAPGTFLYTDDATELLTEAFHNIARTGRSLRIGIYMNDAKRPQQRNIPSVIDLITRATTTTSVVVRGVSMELKWEDHEFNPRHDTFSLQDTFRVLLQLGNSWTHDVDIHIVEHVYSDHSITNLRYTSNDKRLIIDQITPIGKLDIEQDDFLSLSSVFSNHIIRRIAIRNCLFWSEDIVNLVRHFAGNLAPLDMSGALLYIDDTAIKPHHQWNDIFPILEELRLECSFFNCGFRDDDSGVASYKSFQSVSEWRQELVTFSESGPDGGGIGELRDWNVDEDEDVVGTNGTWYRWLE